MYLGFPVIRQLKIEHIKKKPSVFFFWRPVGRKNQEKLGVESDGMGMAEVSSD